jgi:hypothetical protein
MQEWGEVQMGRKVQMGVVVTAAGTWKKPEEGRKCSERSPSNGCVAGERQRDRWYRAVVHVGVQSNR